MKKLGILAIGVLSISLLATMQLSVTAPPPRHGAGLDIYFYETPDRAYTALLADEVDLVQSPLTYEQYSDAVNDPRIQLAPYAENGMYQFDLNNNQTIMDHPGWTNPCSVNTVRQAIAFLVDKDYIIAQILQGFGARIDVPVPYPQTEGWVNPYVVTYDWDHNGTIEPEEDNYPYKYSPDAAAELLAKCSFGDTDGNGYLNYPDDPLVWGGAAGIDTTLMPLKICITADHDHRRAAGQYLYSQLEGDSEVAGDSVLALSSVWADYGKVGGDFDTTDTKWIASEADLSPIVTMNRSYHIYTGGSPKLERYPPMYLFELYHSAFWYPNGSNYVRSPYCEEAVPHKYNKTCMPDFGQHSDGWCWVAALANSLYWFKHAGGLKDLYPDEWDNDTIKNVCPDCEEGYPRLFKEIADAAGKEFCETITNEEYEAMLDTLFEELGEELEWTKHEPPTLEQYKANLSRCQDVILVTAGLLPPNLHDVTGVSYDQSKTPPTVDYSDPWTPGAPDHNIDPDHPKDYDEATWEDLNVSKLYVICPKKGGSLDRALEWMHYASDINETQAGCRNAQFYLINDCVSIPLWSYTSYVAFHKDLVGVVNENGYGLVNDYTFLNAKKCNDPATPEDESQEPIRMGIVHVPKQLNILYSSSYSDYGVLDRMFSHLLQVNPYNIGVDNPWIAQDWEVTEWYDPQDGEIKTVVTYWIRKDVFWHAPVTGAEVRQFTAHDVEFSIWYPYAWDDCWHYNAVMNVHHTNIVDDFTIEIYFDVQSMWAQYWIGQIPLLPKDEYPDLLCKEVCVDIPIVDPVEPIDKMVFTSDQVVQLINATKDGTPLVEGVDFEIFATGPPDYCHNEIHWLIALNPGDTVRICYWTPDLDPHGYYLAKLPWQQTFYTLGTHYPIDITPGAEGYALFSCNPTHFLGAPPRGEIDWMWTWIEGPKPRDGYYQVTLPDAIYLLKAYGSRGDNVPSVNWFPGADLDCYDLCHVGLYDAVMLLTNYGQKFGQPRQDT